MNTTTKRNTLIKCVDTLVSREILLSANAFMILIQEDVDSFWFESFENLYDNSPEIFEYWLVSDWLADKLDEFREPIAKEFYGFNVWGRTSTGQAIAMDCVFSNIVELTGYNGWTS